MFKVTVPSKLFVNKATSPPNSDTEDGIKVPVPALSLASILINLGASPVTKLAVSLLATGGYGKISK